MDQLPLFETSENLRAVLIPFLIRCGVAAACGALIGVERELRRKPAGFRTNILICVGAAMYMIVGLLLVNEAGEVQTDASRIAAQVVTGIGFLGAGCILQAGGRVTGLTSAATIWVVAAIGLISGAGFPIRASIGAVMVVLTLAALRQVEKLWLEPAAAKQGGALDE
jgi:putative Mg2+ transporter-C (MgtC) family protein